MLDIRNLTKNQKRLGAVLGGMMMAGLAWASPWDIDMTDSVAFKAFEWKMENPRVEGTVQRPAGAVVRVKSNGAYQNDYIAQHDRLKPDGASLQNPYPMDEAALKQGEKMFRFSCAPCHGLEGKGNGPVTYNKPDADPKKAIRRFAMPAPLLSGDGAVSPNRTDGYIYLTIRNGGAGMPAYGVSLTDQERWAIVGYIRTLEGGAWAPPAPPTPSPAVPATSPG